jgi:hypothetical protein
MTGFSEEGNGFFGLKIQLEVLDQLCKSKLVKWLTL